MRSPIRASLLTGTLLTILIASLPAVASAQVIPPEPPPCRIPCPFPEGPIVVEDYRVEVTITDQVATTTVVEVLRNDGTWMAETEFLHPLPPGAVVTGLTLWIDGEPVEGEVLPADEAAEVYRRIVAEIRDPALLEFVDHGLVRASVFPIPAGGERRIELEYTQVLEADQGLVRYRHPLGTELGGRTAPEHMSAHIEISSSVPIASVYSPTHEVSIDRSNRRHATVGWESGDEIPDIPLSLYYSVGDGEIGLNVLSFREPGAEDPGGFFVLLASPGIADDGDRVIAKDIILVIDRSGSMEGDKFRQAQDAAAFVLGNLNQDDRFSVMSFSTGVDAYRSGLRPADEAGAAIHWIEGLGPAGSTNIDMALLEAFGVAGVERPTYVLFLTDGLPTEGEIDTDDILANAAEAASRNIRVFAFGVGYDVDTILLDSLAEQHQGTTDYVTPDEDIEATVSGLYRKLSNPVLTGLEIDFGGVQAYDLYPASLPDLFSGEQLIVVGRYREGGTTDIVLRGMIGDEAHTFTYQARTFESQGGMDAIPRLWATRKIGTLLRDIRIHGADEETISQIVALSIRYGIVTPYTSYLVTEDAPFGAAEQERLSEDAYAAAASTTLEPSGEGAVEAAEAAGALSDAEGTAAPVAAYRDLIRVAGSRTFLWSDGAWVDTAYDPDVMDSVAVPFLSDGYFALAAADPALAEALSVGEQVIVVWRGSAYRVVEEGHPADPIDLDATTTTSVTSTNGTVGSTTATTVTAAPAEAPADATPWWLFVAGMATLSAALLTVALLLRHRRI
ncbi:MAG: VWA domain-containing protein [Actinobacteria bacterium]|nr:VWA domain-containing protein [Actinomycetota bacterium]